MPRQPHLNLARKLRRDMSLPERLLWLRLKSRESGGPVFRRQYPYHPYILDFYCAKAKLVIEVDGFSHDVSDQSDRDATRDDHLKAQGMHILRIAARDVLADPDDIADSI